MIKRFVQALPLLKQTAGTKPLRMQLPPKIRIDPSALSGSCSAVRQTENAVAARPNAETAVMTNSALD
jgi:hypothetical protein